MNVWELLALKTGKHRENTLNRPKYANGEKFDAIIPTTGSLHLNLAQTFASGSCNSVILIHPNKKSPQHAGVTGFEVAPRAGLEPATYGLTVRRSTN